MRLKNEVVQFFQNQGCVIVATIDSNGYAHAACKGIVRISPSGRVYLFDLYRQRTHDNLRRNHRISISAVDEHKFTGYCLKGKARLAGEGKINARLIRAWEDRITGRLTQRLLKNIREERVRSGHPEALLPRPEYLIVMDVEEVVDLTPQHIK
jgi:predicted pyridoxine 5'-phosphate oxidase superfamily flavin-nucleotide-binding protein